MMVHTEPGLLRRGDGWSAFNAEQIAALEEKKRTLAMRDKWTVTVVVFGQAKTFEVVARNITEARAAAAKQVKVTVASAVQEGA